VSRDKTPAGAPSHQKRVLHFDATADAHPHHRLEQRKHYDHDVDVDADEIEIVTSKAHVVGELHERKGSVHRTDSLV
jgi:hypothetical protein